MPQCHQFGEMETSPGTNDVGSNVWADRGNSNENNTLLSFIELRQKFQKHFFKYLQIRSFTKMQNPAGALEPSREAATLISLFCQSIVAEAKEEQLGAPALKRIFQ